MSTFHSHLRGLTRLNPRLLPHLKMLLLSVICRRRMMHQQRLGSNSRQRAIAGGFSDVKHVFRAGSSHVVESRIQLRLSTPRMSVKSATLLLISVVLVSAHKLPKRKIWQQRVITWAFRDPFRLVAHDDSRQLLRTLISTAFALWEDALDGHLEFHDISNLVDSSKDVVKPAGVDIDILFAKGSHGDNEAFDGKGKMVAHSVYPPGGVLHLDADENWSFDGSRGVDLRYVMIHEIGHLLGLRHSRKRSSVMSRYYRTLKTGMQIPQVDVESIRRLYGLTERTP